MTQTATAFGLASYRFTNAYGGNLHAPPSSLGSIGGAWQQARDSAQDNISKSLLPIFDRKRPVIPRSSRENSLVAADLSILQTLRPSGQHWYESQLSRSTAGTERYGPSSARILFRCEDAAYDKISFDIGAGLQTFLTGFVTFADFVGHAASELELDELLGIITGAGGSPETYAAIPWISLSLKDKFQRARPHQYAYEANHDYFEYELSQTCHSPSLPSGHCFQAAAFALLAHDTISKHATWGKYVSQLPLWAASVGDRRNCAGLHFPSDNWASWIALATVIPLMFAADHDLTRAKARLGSNIQSSLCFRHSANRPDFSDALALLISMGISLP